MAPLYPPEVDTAPKRIGALLVSYGIYSIAFGYLAARLDWPSMSELPILVGLFLLGVLAHEFGHYYAARRYGYTSSRPFFFVWGAAVNIEPPIPDAIHKAFVYLAGPLFGFTYAGLALAIGLLGHSALFFFVGLITIWVNLGALIPLKRSDGRHILGGLRAKR